MTNWKSCSPGAWSSAHIGYCQRDGVRIGFFGLMGKDAAEVAPFADPVMTLVTRSLPLKRQMVAKLREEEKVDLVICLSHSGLSEDKDRSEDEILAKEVDGIDSYYQRCHTHTKTTGALQVNKTIIVQAWEYGKQVGILDKNIYNDGRVSLKKYGFIKY